MAEMAGPVREAADRAAAVAPRVEELADKVAAARADLLAALAPLHDAAGLDDEAAEAFRAAHGPLSQVFAIAMQDFAAVAGRLLDGITAP